MPYDLRNIAILKETDKAFQVRQDAKPNREPVIAWIPKSQCSYIRRFGKPDSDGTKRMDVKIPDWLGDEKGFRE